MSEKLNIEAQVEGYKYSPDKWREVADEIDFLGDKFNKHFEGDSAYLFWEVHSSIQTLMARIDHVNETGHYCEFPDECVK